MGDWNAGAVFGVIWICILTPLHITFAFFFWSRREVQPIKARFPALVLGCDFILILFEIALCIQRIVGDSYPCLLNLWSGFIGLLVLFNTYMWRCWMLYFTFGLTQERFEGKKKAESFFLRHRYLVNPKFLTQVMGTLTVILTLPCGIITAQNRALPELQGDNCDRGTGDVVLASYGAVYVCVFLFFSFKLRQVVDGFKIKEEMKFTGLIAIIVFIPWVTFNNFAKSANADFPFSTLFLLLGVAFAFGLSTTWPLARSYFSPVNLEEALGGSGGDFSTLDGLLQDKGGLGSFKKFLTKEFSVENILFYEEVEEYRAKKKARLDALQLVAEAQRIYAKYILNESPFQVNLPDLIVKDLEGRLKDVFEKPDIQLGPEKPLVENPARVPPTLFDRAQENIYKLMYSDSFPRYVRSDEYKKLCTEAEENKKRLIILVDEGIAEKKSISTSRKESSRLGTIEKGGGGGGDEQYQPDEDGDKSPGERGTATTSQDTSPSPTASSSVSPSPE